MVSVDHAEPTDVQDRLLWRDAQQMCDRHPAPDSDNHCTWCGQAWPCPPRRLAERAAAAACRPWREGWTARHDMNGLRALPSWRADLGGRTAAASNLGLDTAVESVGRSGRSGTNRGLFD
ncbi:hypothetical protein F4553_003740 [Allocatelliglobosispora scoriae]|uniref:Uncharacterized protein n=1 Tax=Allocatelliglobosispora scoriae TaxID=643052 RepID=A0A841BUC6_9ACTN|nr:hypothetical protein [Allocatelliglobosispora scoriae]MBB5870361.1 hypothetical protein [Allocatelliglobosispora scoriae]